MLALLVRWRVALAGVFLISLAFSATFSILVHLNQPEHDFYGFYRPVALNIAHGRGITLNGAIADAYPPGFPLLLAAAFRLAGDSGHVVLAVQMLLGAGTAVLLAVVVGRVTNRRAGLIAGLLWASYPLGLVAATSDLSEPSALLLLMCALALLVRPRRGSPRWWAWIGAGLLFGAGSLVRPEGIAVGVLVAGTFAVLCRKRRRSLAEASALVVGNVAALVPWEAWVLAETSRLVPLSTGGPTVISQSFTILGRGEQKGSAWVPSAARQIGVDAQHTAMPTLGAIVRFVLHQVQHHPWAVVELYLLKAARSWFGTESLRWENLIAIIQIPYILLGAYGLLLLWRRSRVVASTALVIIGYYWLSTIVALSIVRYLLPGLVIVVGAAAIALDHLLSETWGPPIQRWWTTRWASDGSSKSGVHGRR